MFHLEIAYIQFRYLRKISTECSVFDVLRRKTTFLGINQGHVYE
jgi:hypothetical protein